ncbi:PREDICTED: uncharacterized protein LOC106894440 [Calidris pugnax]|uniref:uncharacterized protein LOC106894440 n=1 Tax=Calidris pugnax TaxID=198806 RepID=UPI00071CECD2|nr:PREDICTED: uncharacterized protein LOC106894440 [Calidris pugnax]
MTSSQKVVPVRKQVLLSCPAEKPHPRNHMLNQLRRSRENRNKESSFTAVQLGSDPRDSQAGGPPPCTLQQRACAQPPPRPNLPPPGGSTLATALTSQRTNQRQAAPESSRAFLTAAPPTFSTFPPGSTNQRHCPRFCANQRRTSRSFYQLLHRAFRSIRALGNFQIFKFWRTHTKTSGSSFLLERDWRGKKASNFCNSGLFAWDYFGRRMGTSV